MRGGDTGSFGWIVCVTPAPERRAGSVHMDRVYLLSMCPSSTLPLETLVPCTGKSTGARWNRDTKFSSSGEDWGTFSFRQVVSSSSLT